MPGDKNPTDILPNLLEKDKTVENYENIDIDKEIEKIEKEINGLQEKLNNISKGRQERLEKIKSLEKELQNIEKEERKENTQLVSTITGDNVLERISEHYGDDDSESAQLTKILKEIAEKNPIETNNKKEVKILKKEGSKAVKEAVIRLREKIKEIEKENGDATKEKEDLIRVEKIGEDIGLKLDEVKEKNKKRVLEKISWPEAKNKVLKITKYLVFIGALYLAAGGISKNNDGNTTWSLKTLSERTFAFKKNNQLASPEMKSAVEIMKKNNLHFNTNEIFTPEASIKSFEIKASGFNLPINNLSSESFVKSKRTKCFGYVCDGLVAAGVSREELALWGDAWTYEKNVLDAGAEQVYSLYNLHNSNIKEFNKNKIKKYFKENCKKDSESGIYTAETFQHGDIVSLYFSGSGHFDWAYKGGNGKLHTHAGIIIEENGQKYLIHTIEERRRKDKLEDIINGKALEGKNHFGIVEIIRPDYTSSKEKKVVLEKPIYDISKFVKKSYNRGNIKSLQSKTGYQLLECLKMNRETIKKIYNLTQEETNDILSLSMAVFGNESTFGDGEVYVEEATDEKNIISLHQVMRNIADMIDYDDISRGIGQIKEEKTLQEFDSLFVNMDRYSVQYAASATPFILGSIYNHLKNFCKINNINISKKNTLNITLCVYNKGWDDDTYTKPVEERLKDFNDGKFSLDEYNKFNYVVKAESILRNVQFDFYKDENRNNLTQANTNDTKTWNNISSNTNMSKNSKFHSYKNQSNKNKLITINTSRRNKGGV